MIIAGGNTLEYIALLNQKPHEKPRESVLKETKLLNKPQKSPPCHSTAEAKAGNPSPPSCCLRRSDQQHGRAVMAGNEQDFSLPCRIVANSMFIKTSFLALFLLCCSPMWLICLETQRGVTGWSSPRGQLAVGSRHRLFLVSGP